MKSGVIFSLIVATFAFAASAYAGETRHLKAQLLAMNEFRVESVRSSSDVLAKFFAACDPLSDSRCPSAPPRCGAEGFQVSGAGLDSGAYRSCAALGGASPGGISGDVAQGCACSTTCERTGREVTGRWNCDACVAVCE